MSQKNFIITQNSTLGRYIVAACDIPAGEIIVDEEPLISGPVSTFPSVSGKNHSKHDSSVQEDDICPVCCCLIKSQEVTTSIKTTIISCPRCCLRLCSVSCMKSTIHISYECKVLQKLPRSLIPYDNRAFLYQFVNTIRALYLRVQTRHEDKLKWTQVSQLQGKVKELEKAGAFSFPDFDSLFSQLRWEWFTTTDEINETDKEEGMIITMPEESVQSVARHCLGVMRTNAFSCVTNCNAREGLYFLSSLMAHSCLMNTDRQFAADRSSGSSHGIRMITRATKDIMEGQTISTSYLSIMNGTHERYFETRGTWLFICKCSRCLDPTECGTFLSTVACTQCKDMTMQPRIGESSQNELKWKCDKCSHVHSARDESEVPSSLKVVNDAKPKSLLQQDIKEVEDWLDAFDNGKYIHTNHSTFTQVKLYLCQYYGRESGIDKLESSRLQRKGKYCMRLDEILYKMFAGGLYSLRGKKPCIWQTV
jgi:hypothetical protein